MSDTTYNGWTNYQTWVVKLWMDNEQQEQEYWHMIAISAYNMSADKMPNEYMTHDRNAVNILADMIKDCHEEQMATVLGSKQPTVYNDLLNSALGLVNWHEIAAHMIEDVKEGME